MIPHPVPGASRCAWWRMEFIPGNRKSSVKGLTVNGKVCSVALMLTRTGTELLIRLRKRMWTITSRPTALTLRTWHRCFPHRHMQPGITGSPGRMQADSRLRTWATAGCVFSMIIPAGQGPYGVMPSLSGVMTWNRVRITRSSWNTGITTVQGMPDRPILCSITMCSSGATL